jgi:DNA modification methylase
MGCVNHSLTFDPAPSVAPYVEHSHGDMTRHTGGNGGRQPPSARMGGVMSKAGNGAKASGNGASAPQNELHFGDNLDVLRAMPAETVDLIYLDPPFNSQAIYGVIYGTKRGGPSQAQSHAFKDMWTWGPDAQRALNQTAERHLEAGALLDAFQKVFPGDSMIAYLAMMAVRLIEMHRILKPTGSLYLHCDPTASHYLKILLDTVFGPKRFTNEIIWRRTSAHSDAKRYASVHDTLLLYNKGDNPTWNPQYEDYTEEYIKTHFVHNDPDGRVFRRVDLRSPHPRPNLTYDYTASNGVIYKPHANGWAVSKEKMAELDKAGRLFFPKKSGGRLRRKLYFEDSLGVPIADTWTDIKPIFATAEERLGYSTQKPIDLLKRIIEASSNKGDIVLDPFCGCGTAIEAAEELGRNWIGIDVTYLAIHVVEGRLVKAFRPEIKDRYKLLGRPKDADDARALAARDWLEFQKWAVFQLGGLPKERPGPDGGIDGIIRYHRVGVEQPHRAVVSVKGGEHVGVDAIHKLKSVVKREGAELGVLVCLDEPTRGMEKEILSEGEVGPPSRRVQKLQIVPIAKLFERHPLDIPGTLDPPEIVRFTPTTPIKKRRNVVEGQTEMLLALENPQTPYQADKPRKRGRQIRPVDIEVISPGPARKTK